MKKVNEQCLNCRNYTQGICKGAKDGKCNIADLIHTTKSGHCEWKNCEVMEVTEEEMLECTWNNDCENCSMNTKSSSYEERGEKMKYIFRCLRCGSDVETSLGGGTKGKESVECETCGCGFNVTGYKNGKIQITRTDLKRGKR